MVLSTALRQRDMPETSAGRLNSPVRLSCETITAGTPCSRAHRPVQRSVVRSEISSRSGFSSSAAASCAAAAVPGTRR